MKTKVIFRTYRDKTKEVLAVFPEIPADSSGFNVSCYAHTGQHGSADPFHVIRMTRPATAEESAPLKRELESIGYDVTECRKITVRMHQDRLADAVISKILAERHTA